MDEGLTLFATTNFRNQQRPFGIKLDDRRRHMYVIGKTGMGKSTLLENMVIQDIRDGRGLALVDPHGDFVEKVLKFIPSHRVNDVIYLNPADVDFPIAFNILESIDIAQRHLVSSGLIAVFKKLWVDSWGPRLEYILRNTILALIEYPGSTLLGVNRMLVDKDYRNKVIRHISDPIVKAFWTTEYTAYANQFRTEAIAPIQNKIGQFLSSAIIRNIVGQPKSTIDMREIMDSGKILLLNLAKGRIGEDNAALLGAMMITKLQVAAMSRVNIPETERRDFFLYVDEFQNFATESFANILSEARKYRLDLIMAHQYVEQLDETVRAAVFGNVGTMICFRVGAADAEFLAKEFEPVFTETDLVNLTKYDVYLKLMIDGVASEPFSATGMPPVENPDNLDDVVIRVSRERYAKPRSTVEEKISRWSGTMEEAALTQAIEARKPETPDLDVSTREPVVQNAIPDSISLSEALKTPPQNAGRPPRREPREQSERSDARPPRREAGNQPRQSEPRLSDRQPDGPRPTQPRSSDRRDDRRSTSRPSESQAHRSEPHRSRDNRPSQGARPAQLSQPPRPAQIAPRSSQPPAQSEPRPLSILEPEPASQPPIPQPPIPPVPPPAPKPSHGQRLQPGEVVKLG